MVMLSRFATATTLAALFSVAAAQFKVITPGGPDSWWVAKSNNVLSWDCKNSPSATFTVLIANKDPKILVSPQAFIAIQDNADCSKLVTQDQVNQAPGSGYTLQLANTLNSTNVYAESEEFEIKPLGSPFPTSSAPVPTATGAGAANSTGGSSGGSSGGKDTNSASSTKTSLALGAAAVGAALFGFMA